MYVMRSQKLSIQKRKRWKKIQYICDVCGWIYDPAVGDPDGIPPGTGFEDIPDDWECPEAELAKMISR